MSRMLLRWLARSVRWRAGRLLEAGRLRALRLR
jgi:hypothetical protein